MQIFWGIRTSSNTVQSWNLVRPETISNVFESLKSIKTFSNYVSAKKTGKKFRDVAIPCCLP